MRKIQQAFEGKEVKYYSFGTFLHRSKFVRHRSLCTRRKVFGKEEFSSHREKEHRHQQVEAVFLHRVENLQKPFADQIPHLGLLQVREQTQQQVLEMDEQEFRQGARLL